MSWWEKALSNKDLLQRGGQFLHQYWTGLEQPIKDVAVNYLTTTAMDALGSKGRARSADSSVFTGPQARERGVGMPYEERYTVTPKEGKPYLKQGFNQRWSREAPEWAANVPGAGWAFDNPGQAADIAGALGAGAITTGGGWLLEKFENAGRKPRSEYAAPVEPYRGSYNSSVESAEASAFYKHQLEEQKFRHKMELMQAREQSRIPGVQNTSVGSYGGGNLNSSNPLGGVLTNAFGNTRVFPDTPSITSIPLG